MKMQKRFSVLMCLLLLAACSTIPHAPVVMQRTQVQVALPQPGLMDLCTDPELLIPSDTVEKVIGNGLSWKKSQKDCKARMQCLVWWLQAASRGNVLATCAELETLHGAKEKNHPSKATP